MSFKARTSNIPGLSFLRWLLCIGFINEMISQTLKIIDVNNNVSHYIYIPLEYVFLVLFFYKNTKSKLFKNAMLWSVCVYFIIVVPLMLLYYRQLHFPYPSIIYNINCVFNILWISLLLFNLELTENLSIISIPVFWIFTAMLIFYSGIFFFNGAYNYFMNHDVVLAYKLRSYINIMLNNILYLLFSYAFFNSWKITKYSYQ